MLRRRAGTVEGRDRWGAAEELLLFQRGFGYREPRYPSPLFSTERKDRDRRGRAGDWHLPPPPYLAICAVSVPNGGIERWICVRETWGGWDEQVYTACAQFNYCHQTRCCIRLLLCLASPGPLWTRTALCVCCNFDFWFFLKFAYHVHIFVVFHCSLTCCVGSYCAYSLIEPIGLKWCQQELAILAHYNAALQGRAQSLIEILI